MAEDDDWLSNLLWTDEAHFTLRGSVNTYNCRIPATENPRTVVETPLHDEKVTVWVGFTTSTVIGTFFFEEMRDSGFVTATVTGERYADMLQNCIIPSLADKTCWNAGRLVMIVCSAATFIMLGLPGPQISVRAIYWLWGYLKSQVYRDRPISLGMLKDNIRLQCLTITPDMLYSAERYS
ncbi:uncharacterized protein TNCV_324551 [Trichonephila clavipes]|nr:uncharacterized protein TNCV_324551 [Trichonephila clavipes]